MGGCLPEPGTMASASAKPQMAAATEVATAETKSGLPFYSAAPGVAPLPYGKPGPMTDAER